MHCELIIPRLSFPHPDLHLINSATQVTQLQSTLKRRKTPEHIEARNPQLWSIIKNLPILQDQDKPSVPESSPAKSNKKGSFHFQKNKLILSVFHSCLKKIHRLKKKTSKRMSFHTTNIRSSPKIPWLSMCCWSIKRLVRSISAQDMSPFKFYLAMALTLLFPLHLLSYLIFNFRMF